MIFNPTGSGGGMGATLTVTAPAGCTVTVSKDGKTKTKTADSSGVAVFKGLATGTWTLIITDGVQTSAPKAVTITTDYNTTIAFFSATINVTYPAGSTCTATDGVTTLTAPDTSGKWQYVVGNVGTWTLAVGTRKIEVDITSNGQTVSVDLNPIPIKLKVEHHQNSNSINITIKKKSDSSTVTTGSLTGAASYATMNNNNYTFTYDTAPYILRCTVRDKTTPFFMGTLIRNGTTVSSFSGGSGFANSSYQWSFEQEGVM